MTLSSHLMQFLPNTLQFTTINDDGDDAEEKPAVYADTECTMIRPLTSDCFAYWQHLPPVEYFYSHRLVSLLDHVVQRWEMTS